MNTNKADAKIPLKVWFTSGAAGMVSYLDAAAIVSTGTALVLYQEPLGLTSGQIGALSSVLTIMIGIGALVGGRLGDKFGRRKVFMTTLFVYILGALILAMAQDVAFLYVGIPILGFAVGADLPVSLATIAEEAPEGTSGKLVSFSHLLWMIGMAATLVIQIFVGSMGATGARVLYWHVIIVAAVVLILRTRLPESPKWQAAHNAALTEASDNFSVSDLRSLVKRPWLAPLIATSLFYAFVNIAANTNGQFGTYLYVNVAGSTVEMASTIGLITMAVAFVMTFVLMKIADKTYRMRVFGICSLLNIIAFVIPAVFGVVVPTLIVSGLLGTIGGAIAGEPMFKVWVQELFPTRLRSTAQGFGIAFTRLVAAAVALVTPTILDAGPKSLYIFIGVMVTLSVGIGYFWIGRMPKADEIDSEEANLSGIQE